MEKQRKSTQAMPIIPKQLLFEVVSAEELPELLFLAFVLSLPKKRLLFDKQCAALDAR